MRTLPLTGLGLLALAIVAVVAAEDAGATPLAVADVHHGAADSGSSFGYRCGPRIRRVRRVYVRRRVCPPVYTTTCYPRYAYRPYYARPYYRPYYYPSVSIGLGFGYGHRHHAHHRHHGHRHHGHHGGRHVGRRR